MVNKRVEMVKHTYSGHFFTFPKLLALSWMCGQNSCVTLISSFICMLMHQEIWGQVILDLVFFFCILKRLKETGTAIHHVDRGYGQSKAYFQPSSHGSQLQ